MKRRTAISREPSAEAVAESERRAWAVGEMLGESEKRFPGLVRAVLSPAWAKKLDAYVSEPLEPRGAG